MVVSTTYKSNPPKILVTLTKTINSLTLAKSERTLYNRCGILLIFFGNLDASEFFARAKKFGFLQFFRVLTRKNSNFYSLRVPDPKKPEL